MRAAVFVLLTAAVSCKSSGNVTQHHAAAPSASVATPTAPAAPGPPALVYKTKADYHDRVPVLLSADRQEIVSYPHPNDLTTGGQLALPVTLRNGYLLDNRGIGPNVAFLRLTYADYARLTQPPTLKELNAMIIDRDPLVELCDCGSKNTYANLTADLNQLIDRQQLRTKCKSLK